MAEEDSSKPLTSAELQQLIEDALTIKLKESTNTPKTIDNNQAIIGVLQEFLDSFYLIAYDTEGSPIVIKSVKNFQENEAIISLLSKIYNVEISEEVEFIALDDQDEESF
jgi:hypothetical protein